MFPGLKSRCPNVSGMFDCAHAVSASLTCRPEFLHFFFAQGRRRGLVLSLHELRHHVYERIYQSQKSGGPKIPASSL